MNVTDIQFEDETGDKLELIFKKQSELMAKYHKIEEENGTGYALIKNEGYNINSPKTQALLKDFAWRITEEITEATEHTLEEHKEHVLEEVADALHFMVELCIVVGIKPDELPKEFRPHSDKLTCLCSVRFGKPNAYSIVQHLGLAMNCLKQKPWKKTHILTDENKFKGHIIDAFRELCRFWVCLGSNDLTLYNYYFRKNKVNQFRQKTNY